MFSRIIAMALAVSAVCAHPGASPVVQLDARETSSSASLTIAGHLVGTLGPAQGTAGGAINGVTGFVEGCIGGGFAKDGITSCYPVETAPPNTASSVLFGGNAVGTLGPASGFLSAPGYCGGAAFGSEGYTLCLESSQNAKAAQTPAPKN